MQIALVFLVLSVLCMVLGRALEWVADRLLRTTDRPPA